MSQTTKAPLNYLSRMNVLSVIPKYTAFVCKPLDQWPKLEPCIAGWVWGSLHLKAPPSQLLLLHIMCLLRKVSLQKMSQCELSVICAIGIWFSQSEGLSCLLMDYVHLCVLSFGLIYICASNDNVVYLHYHQNILSKYAGVSSMLPMKESNEASANSKYVQVVQHAMKVVSQFSMSPEGLSTTYILIWTVYVSGNTSDTC